MASVLVVDDEEDIRDLLRINLELDGHEVVTMSSGPEALDCLESHRPDVIVLDLMMPGMDGWEVLTRLKMGQSEAASVPVAASPRVLTNARVPSPSCPSEL
jgi:CheY-like chemotaxis protein